MQKVFIGIDPGQTGAMAVLFTTVSSCDSKLLLLQNASVVDFTDLGAACNLMGRITKNYDPFDVYCMIERIQLRQADRQGVKSAQTFGVNTGMWLGALTAKLILYEEVTPQKWQNTIFANEEPQYRHDKKRGKVRDTKAMSLDFARRTYPKLLDKLRYKKNDGRADALCIATYCMLTATKREGISVNLHRARR